MNSSAILCPCFCVCPHRVRLQERSLGIMRSLVTILVILPILQIIAAVNGEETILTGPSGIVSTIPMSRRFSRLLQDNAATLQFSSISNAAPPLSGLSKEFRELKQKSHKKKAHSSGTISPTLLGRRTLDYDDSESFYENGEPIPRIITQPQPGNEYVYIRQGGIQTEEQQAAAASVTSINKQPVSNRVPLTLLRQSNGKRVNISPIFSDQQNSFQPDVTVSEDAKPTVSNINDEAEIDTTIAPQNVMEEDEPKMTVSVVTSAPRSESEDQNCTSQIHEIKDSFVNPTPFITTQTPETPAPTTKATSPKPTEDTKENLLVQSSRRIGSFSDFEDSPTSLQTSESSSQPARVHVKPAESGKELEYEYIYYYYDDDEAANGTDATDDKVKGASSPSKASNSAHQRPASSSTTTTALPTSNTQDEADFDDEEDDKFLEAPVAEASPKTTAAPVRTTAAPVKPSNDNHSKFLLKRSKCIIESICAHTFLHCLFRRHCQPIGQIQGSQANL
jgi:hypothetical protein